MPDEDDPSHAKWSPAIRREMANLDDDAIVAGHSVGATILINALAEQPPECVLEAIVLIAAPFVGEGGRPSDEFELPKDLGARLSARRAGPRVPWPAGRDRPTVTCRPVCPGDPAGASAPAPRA